MTATDLPFVFSGAFWSAYALPVALLVLCLCGGLVVAKGRKSKQSTTQILGAFFVVVGLYFADGRTALPLAVFMLALLCGLVAGYEWAPARARHRHRERRRVGRPNA